MKKSTSILLYFFQITCFYNIANAVNTSNKNEAYINSSDFLKKSQKLGFQENKGQMADTEGNPVSYVLFKAEAPGINIWVTTTGLSYQFLKFEEDVKKEQKGESKKLMHNEIEKNRKMNWHRVDMILKDAQIKKENIITEEDITQAKVDYYLGHCPDGIFSVKTFSKIIIKNIYIGIDWVLYTNGKSNSLKQDFIVHPHADPNQIKLIYEGAGSFEVNNNQIRFENAIGELQEGKLFCYQRGENNEIQSKYIVKKNQKVTNSGAGNSLNQLLTINKEQLFSYEIGIETDKYNKNEILIIDPQLVWATHYANGNNSSGISESIENDNLGNVYITGETYTTNFPSLNSGNNSFFQGTISGSSDIFISKFNNAGALLWATYYGGNQLDEPKNIAIDQNNNVIMTGRSESSNFPVFNPGGNAYFNNINSNYDIIIIKFSNNGVRLWATLYGGSADDFGYAICSDNNSNIYITGRTTSNDFPVYNPGGGAYFKLPPQQASLFVNDAFILKFSSSGVCLWATCIDGISETVGTAISCDITGNLFLGGSTNSTSSFPLVNPGGGAYFQNTNAGIGTVYGDMFLMKFNAQGIMQWSTLYGGDSDDYPSSIKIDSNGNLFVAGGTSSTNLPVLNAGNGSYFQPAPGTSIQGSAIVDLFILKFDNNGIRLWATYYYAIQTSLWLIHDLTNVFDNLDIDQCNNIYLGLNSDCLNGGYHNVPMACDGGYHDNNMNGLNSILVIKFSNSGILLWGTYIEGSASNYDTGEALTVDNNGNLFITGNWSSNGNGAYPTVNPGGGAFYNGTYNSANTSVYIAKFSPNQINASVQTTNTTQCSCNASVNATATGGCSAYMFQWYNSGWSQIGNTSSLTNLCPGTYQVIVRDSINCSMPDTVSITIPGSVGTLPNVSVNATMQICNFSNNIITANSTTPGVTYSWAGPGIVSGNNNSNVTVNLAGTYTITVTDPISTCTNTATITVTAYPLPNLSTGNPLILNCLQNSGMLSASSSTQGATFNWLGTGITSGANTNSPTVNLAGSYTVIVTDPSTGCTISATTIVAYTPKPVANISGDATIYIGQSTTLIASGGSSYNWFPSINLNNINTSSVIASPTENTTYCVEVTDSNNCKDTACITIALEEPPCITNSTFEVPNAFSPNGDNINDEFCLQGWDECLTDFSIVIFDRWGEKIFQSNDSNFCWDGFYNNKIMDSQVLIYCIKASFENKKRPIIKKGNISVIR